MGLFDFRKKKDELPLPPPPPRMPVPPRLRELGDLEPIVPPALPVEPEFEIPAPREFELPPPEPSEILMMPPREEEVSAIAPPPRIPVRSFIAVEDFKRVIDDSNQIRAKIMEAEDLVRQLGEIKSEEERLFDKWRSGLEHVEQKLAYVDKVIERAQR